MARARALIAAESELATYIVTNRDAITLALRQAVTDAENSERRVREEAPGLIESRLIAQRRVQITQAVYDQTLGLINSVMTAMRVRSSEIRSWCTEYTSPDTGQRGVIVYHVPASLHIDSEDVARANAARAVIVYNDGDVEYVPL